MNDTVWLGWLFIVFGFVVVALFWDMGRIARKNVKAAAANYIRVVDKYGGPEKCETIQEMAEYWQAKDELEES